MSLPPRILVVEDNPIARKLLRLTLESGGYAVTEVADARSALAAMAGALPALVLQDLVLPDMHGFELLRRLRGLPGAAGLPVIALSGFQGHIEEAQTREAGFVELLLKPLEPDALLEVIRRHLPTQRPREDRRVAERSALLVDDDRARRELARLYLVQHGFAVSTAASTNDAWELHLAKAQALPDVVLCRAQLPGQDGFRFCLRLRHDERYARLPVVLLSEEDDEPSERALARSVGATRLVPRGPSMQRICGAALEALGNAPAPTGSEPPPEVEVAYLRRALARRERELASHEKLARRSSLQAAQIALLSGVADTLRRNVHGELAMRDLLAATLDAAGISKGALFLRDGSGRLTLRHALGFTERQLLELPGFFGHPELLEELVRARAAQSVPGPSFTPKVTEDILDGAEVITAQLVALESDGRGVGAMMLGAQRKDITAEDVVAFARGIGNQLAQAIELADTFERLTVSEERLRALMENASDAITITAPDGTVREVNRRMAGLLGRPRDELVGKSMEELVPGFFPSPGGRGPNPTRDHALPVVEVPQRGAESVLLEVSHETVSVGRTSYVLSIGRDVTAQMRAQAQLRVADRMASLGVLAAGLSHEINNPLAAVTGNLDLAAEFLARLAPALGQEGRAELAAELRDAREAAQQAASIVQDIKVFSRADEARRDPVNVHTVLETAARIAGNEVRDRCKLIKQYGVVPPVRGSESRLGQVFLNLLVNAGQSLPDGHADRHAITVRTSLASDGKHVIVEIADTGAGIPPQALDKVFTPFATTQQQAAGTGLAICHRILGELGGTISVESTLGQGSTFRVVLLVAAPANAAAAASTSTTHVSMTTSMPTDTPASPVAPRLLIVDDEAIVGRMIARLLREAPHELLVTTEAGDALAHCQRGERFALILCDLMMPRMSGMELYEELAALDEEQARRMIFLTGGAFTSQARAFLDAVKNPCLEKPFEPRALRALVAEQLRGSAGARPTMPS